MLEAQCSRCGENFVPHSEEPEDLIHGPTIASDLRENCGGQGVILGEWFPTVQHWAAAREQENTK